MNPFEVLIAVLVGRFALQTPPVEVERDDAVVVGGEERADLVPRHPARGKHVPGLHVVAVGQFDRVLLRKQIILIPAQIPQI